MTAQTPAQQTKPKRTWLRILFWLFGALALVIVIAAAAFLIWALRIPAPMAEALAALESDSAVTVVVDDPITFTPNTAAACGVIFYPGGKVDYRAYAPSMRAIAEAGYFAAISRAPLNLMVFAPNKARAVMAAHQEIDHWVVGGHSLGGSMAALFTFNNPDAAAGLTLWASFPAGSSPLTDRTDLAVSSIHGSLDGLVSAADIEASRALLPPQTAFVEIEGGNHAQFGWYGPQDRDNEATITRAEQQVQTVAATLRTLEAACRP